MVVVLAVVLAVVFLRTRRPGPAGRKAAPAGIAPRGFQSADQPGYLAPMVVNPAYVVPDEVEGDYLAPVASNPDYAVATTIKAGRGGHMYEYSAADAPEGQYAYAEADAAEPAEYMAGGAPMYAEPSPMTAYVQQARLGGIYATVATPFDDDSDESDTPDGPLSLGPSIYSAGPATRTVYAQPEEHDSAAVWAAAELWLDLPTRCTKATAERLLLASAEPGSFLLRSKTGGGGRVLSVWSAAGKALHYRIDEADGMFMLRDTKVAEASYTSLQGLIVGHVHSGTALPVDGVVLTACLPPPGAAAASSDCAVPVANVEPKPKKGFTRTPSVYGFGDDFTEL